MSHSKSPSLFSSFRHAWRGLVLVFRSERNFRLQVLAGLLIGLLIYVLPLESWERAVLLLVVMCVLLLELLNSGVERIIDLVKPRLHEYAGDVKDVMAGTVLLASIFACVIAVVVLLPRVLDFFAL